MAASSASFLGTFLTQMGSDPDGAQGKIINNGQVRKKIKVLKDHAHFGPYFFDIFEVIGQLNPIHNNLAALVFFQSVNTANQRRFPGSGRSADDDPLFFMHGQIDAPEHMEFTKPLVQIYDFDHGFGRCLHIGAFRCFLVHLILR
jgi:hypothetical protein